MTNILTFLLHLLFGHLLERIWRRDMLLSPGTVLHNRYVISKVHEQGLEHAVYLAYDKPQDIDVAIKENGHNEAAHQRRFEMEATLLANLRHPQIPRVVDYFGEDSFQFLVMDYIEGINLQQVLRRRTPSTEEILEWGAQLCDILADLHSLRPPVIHGNIEPTNIILTPEGRLFLVDFGFATVCWPERATSSQGTAGGERSAISETDPRNDQYLLAATLHALLAGATRTYSREYLSGNPVFPRIRPARPDLSPYAEEAIFRALSSDLNRRFRTIEEFKSAL